MPIADDAATRVCSTTTAGGNVATHSEQIGDVGLVELYLSFAKTPLNGT